MSNKSVGAAVIVTFLSVACITTLAVGGEVGTGDSTPDDSDRVQLKEVIVTAERRSANLQNVPVSVTALSSGDLQRQQIADVTTLAFAVPSMTVGKSYDPTDIVIGIRGISEVIPEIGVDPAIGVYINGVYLATLPGSNVGFIDMERVEVLRGPQGTLFGRNTIGGALNITTKEPSDKFEGYAQVDYGNYNTANITGVINLPLIGDQLDARIVYQHTQHTGYDRDAFLNQSLDNGNENYVRASLKAKPNDEWEVLLVGDYMRFIGDSAFQKMNYYDAANPLNGLVPLFNGHPGDMLTNYLGGSYYMNSAKVNPPTSVTVYSGTGTVTGELSSDVTVKSITGYRHVGRNEGTDVDGSPYPVFDILQDPFRENQVSEELQAYGDALGKRLRWISGAYFFHETGYQGITFNAVSPLAPQADDKIAAENSSYAAFGQVTYEILTDLRLTGGVRYTKDERQAEYFDHSNTFSGAFLGCSLAGVSLTPAAGDPTACHVAGSTSFHYVPFNVGLDYRASQFLMLYAKVAKGYRSGGYQQSGPTPAVGATTAAESIAALSAFKAFSPENLLSEEIGAKFDGLGNTFRLNVAAFHSSYDAIQQAFSVASPTGGALSVVENVGKASLYGGEIETTLLIDHLSLEVSLATVQARFTSGPEVGLPFTNSPKYTSGLNADYLIGLNSGSVDLHAGYNWRSSEYFFEPIPGNAAQNAAVRQTGYGLMDARADLKLAGAPLTFSLWSRNLTDKRYWARVTDLVGDGLGFDTYIPGTPRTFGISARWDF